MGQSLSTQKIKDTYVGLLKTASSAQLPSGSLEAISDGLGNDSGLELGQASAKLRGDYLEVVTTDGSTGILHDAANISLPAGLNYYGTHDFTNATVTGLPTDLYVTPETGYEALNLIKPDGVVDTVKFIAGTNITLTTSQLDQSITIDAAGGGGGGLVAGAGTNSMKNADSLVATPAAAAGVCALAIGNGASAAGECSISLGVNSTSPGISSVAVGKDTNATDGSVALAFNAKAIGGDSVAVGSSSCASVAGAIALGASSQATGLYGAALGARSCALGEASLTVGWCLNANGIGSVAMGGYSSAQQRGAVAIGCGAVAGGYSFGSFGGVAIGEYSLAGAQNVAVGTCARTGADQSVLVGFKACGVGASVGNVTIGFEATTDNGATAVGRLAKACSNAIAIGNNARALGGDHIIIGKDACANDGAGIVIGANLARITGSTRSIAIGYAANANGWSELIAIGCGASITGGEYGGVAMGCEARSCSGDGIAIGKGAYIANWWQAGNIAMSRTACSLGWSGIAIGRSSCVTAASDFAIALGREAVANADNATAIGYQVVATQPNAVTSTEFKACVAGRGIIVTSPDGLTTKGIGIDNSGNIVTYTP